VAVSPLQLWKEIVASLYSVFVNSGCIGLLFLSVTAVDDFTPGLPCFQYSFPYCNEEFDSPSLASEVFVIIDAFCFVVVVLVLYNAFAEAALSDLVPADAALFGDDVVDQLVDIFWIGLVIFIMCTLEDA